MLPPLAGLCGYNYGLVESQLQAMQQHEAALQNQVHAYLQQRLAAEVMGDRVCLLEQRLGALGFALRGHSGDPAQLQWAPQVSAHGVGSAAASVSEERGGDRVPCLLQLQPEHTTIVVRNIPSRFNQDRLMELWRPDGSYDFLFLPYSVKQRRTSRYVFINFTSHEACKSFVKEWDGKVIKEDSKPLDIGIAKMQGFIGNMKHHRGMANPKISCRPAVFQDGQRVDFEAAVNELLDGLDYCSEMTTEPSLRTDDD